MRILYATDMDRTIIYSERFLQEYPTSNKTEIAEKKDERVISYISKEVKDRIIKLNNNDNVCIVPITTRSIEEFNRIDIGIKTEYAITSNGGVILKNGKPMDEWNEYISKTVNKIDLMDCAMDLDELATVKRDTKIIDGLYLFNKTDEDLWYACDCELSNLREKYKNLTFTRQRNKIYAVPKSFSKAIALRWLQNMLGYDKLVASGDSELDLPMLAIADYAVIPKHGDLIKNGIVLDGRIIDAGINSPLNTMDIVENLMNSN